jgi:putative oxidoreductase
MRPALGRRQVVSMSIFDLALLILRLAVGLTFAAHGAQKAFGWWQGPGPVNWLKAVHNMGFHPPALFAAASIMAELVGGLALAIGFMTPLAAAILVAQAIVIVVKAHLAKGFFSTRGGLEFPFNLGAASMVVGLLSPGGISIDALLGLDFGAGSRAVMAIFGLALGFLVLAIPRLIPAPAQRPLRHAP